jgi:hypothetical protein
VNDTRPVLDEIAVLVLVTFDALAVNIGFIKAKVWVAADAEIVARVIFSPQRLHAADASVHFVSLSNVGVEDNLELLEIVLTGLEFFPHLSNLEPVEFRVCSFRVLKDAAHLCARHLERAECGLKRLLADLALFCLHGSIT